MDSVNFLKIKSYLYLFYNKKYTFSKIYYIFHRRHFIPKKLLIFVVTAQKGIIAKYGYFLNLEKVASKYRCRYPKGIEGSFVQLKCNGTESTFL